MKKVLLVLTCILFVLVAEAQTVILQKPEQLEVRLKQGKDTLFVLNFWATWCVPCIKELPVFEKFQSYYEARPVKVLLISIDKKSKLESAVKPFVRKNKLLNEVILIDEKVPNSYIASVSKDWKGSLPATLFVNYSKNLQRFYELPFNYDELDKAYLSIDGQNSKSNE
jgi:thiol-disulfide isomerase/thioredoxin